MGFGKEGMRSKKKMKRTYNRNEIAEAHSRKGGTGSGFHSLDKYKRDKSWKKDLTDD